MERTQEQQQQIKDEFARRRKIQLWISLPMILVIFGVVFMEEPLRKGEWGISYDVAGIFMFGVVAAALAFSFRNWRCPACSKYLGKNVNPKFCPKCGVELKG